MKRCYECGVEKPSEEFYRQPTARDGRAGKCKECAKRGTRANRAANADYYREYDRGRTDKPGRVEMRKAYAKYRNNDPDLRAINHARSAEQSRKFPDKRAARIALGNAVRDGLVTVADLCQRCGGPPPLHGHHEDYDKALDVVWMCLRCHGKRHREMNETKRRLTQVSPQPFQPPTVARRPRHRPQTPIKPATLCSPPEDSTRKMSAVTEILAMRSELEGRFEMLDLAIERIEAERRENRIRLETLNACLDLVSREAAGPPEAEEAEARNVPRGTGGETIHPAEVERIAEVARAANRAFERTARASKRAPRRPVRQLVLEAIRKTKTDGTTIEALYLTLPSYRRRLIDSAVAHWITKGNVVEAVGWLYCHGFEPEVVKALAAQVERAAAEEPPEPPVGPTGIVGVRQQLGFGALPQADPPPAPEPAPASSAPSMRQRLIDFMSARGGAAIMQEIMASGIDQAEVYRAESEGKIEAVDARGTYALVLDEGEEAQAAE